MTPQIFSKQINDLPATSQPADSVRIETPIHIGPVSVKNRLVKSAMSEQLGDSANNPRAERLAKLYRRWAAGGAGLMLSGNIMVDRDALGEPSNIVLDQRSDLDAFRTWVRGARFNGARFFAQLNHPGKQVPKFLDSKPMAPSAIPIEGPLAAGFNPPREMTIADIERVIDLFADAARLAKAVGFDGIQLHGAHGYLINQFLSPRHNRRVDAWGEPTRFLMAVYRAVRLAVGADYPVIVKLNSSDFEKGGFSNEDALAVMQQLERIGINAIEVSGGTYEVQAMTGEGQARGGYFLAFARGAKARLSVPVIVTGGFRNRADVLAALADGVDMVGIGRALTLDPDLPTKMMEGVESEFSNRMRPSRWNWLNRVSMLSWFEMQMLRISHGQAPDPDMSVVQAAWHALTHVGLKAFAPRRA